MLHSMLAATAFFMNGFVEDVVIRVPGSSLASSIIQLDCLTSNSRTLILASIVCPKIAMDCFRLIGRESSRMNATDSGMVLTGILKSFEERQQP